MDLSVRQELNTALEDLTHSGRPSLDPQLLKRVKGICKSVHRLFNAAQQFTELVLFLVLFSRQSDSYVRVTYETLMKDLAKDHSEVRFSSFQVMNELFLRSHLFRELLTADFQWFVSLACGTNPNHPLPPPFPVANRLKEESLLAIRQWVDKFGEGYPKLKIGFNFLKHNKRVSHSAPVCACAEPGAPGMVKIMGSVGALSCATCAAVSKHGCCVAHMISYKPPLVS